jgi:RNA polymerase sigma-70 factor (ECF subfamily)
LSKYRNNTREKRGGGEMPLILDELSECIHDNENVESEFDRRALRESISAFLDGLSADARTIFVRRYFSMYEIKEIATEYGITESKVKVTLMRTRKKLHTYLKKEGYL